MSRAAPAVTHRPRLASSARVNTGSCVGGAPAAIALYTTLILLMARPLVGTLDRAIPVIGPGAREYDALTALWAMAWSAHALVTAPTNVFHGNIFYPEPYTLAYGEHLIGVLPLYGPLWAVTGSPVAALNLYYLLSFVLTGLATFVLARAWTGSTPAALFAGLAFAFAPPRIAHHFHIQLLAIWWTPLTLLLIERFLRQPTATRAALAGGCFVMQWLSSIYLGWLLTCALVVYCLATAWAEPRLVTDRRMWLYGLPTIVAAGLLILPTLLPYLVVSERWAFRWPLAELASHSASPSTFLSVPPANVLYTPMLKVFSDGVGVEKNQFLGFSPILLAIVGLVWGLRHRSPAASQPRRVRWFALTMLALATVSVVLTFGPYAGTSPPVSLPYRFLYDWVPGFQGIRNPGRFILLAALGVALLSSLGVAALLARLRPGSPRWAAGGVLLLILTAELFSVLPAEPLPPPDDRALAYLRENAADGPIAILPISRSRGVAETPRMLASTAHWRPMVNGLTSFRPPNHEELAAVLQHADPPAMADALQVLGIRTLVLHLDELLPEEQARLADEAWREAGFVEQLRTDRTAIWRLAPRRVPEVTDEIQVEVRLPGTERAAEQILVRLLFVTEEGRIFHDSVGGAHSMQVEWLPLEAGRAATRHELAVALPRLIVPKPQVKAEFLVPGPAQPGRYRLLLRSPQVTAERTVVVTAR